ncbi:hypothetical protein AOLI_G00262200 [Acnodon oligacanthus]
MHFHYPSASPVEPGHDYVLLRPNPAFLPKVLNPGFFNRSICRNTDVTPAARLCQTDWFVCYVEATWGLLLAKTNGSPTGCDRGAVGFPPHLKPNCGGCRPPEVSRPGAERLDPQTETATFSSAVYHRGAEWSRARRAMDGQHSDRCDSKELDIHPGFWIKMGCPTHNPSDHDTPHTPESQVSELSVLNLHLKLSNLRRKNQELLDINKKWAEQYSSLRQHFEHQVTGLNRRLKSYEQRKEEKEKRTEDFSSLPDKTTQEAELKSRLQKADSEIERLRMQSDTLTSRGQQQEEEIRRLNKVLQRAQKSLAVQQESPQTEETIWKHQALVYKEDFLKERKDRDKLKEKYAELEKKYKKIHADLHAYRAQVRWATSTPSTGPSPHT